MYMIGRAPIEASASMIFCCEALLHRRQVRDVIKESRILHGHPPGIQTVDVPRPPGLDQSVSLGVALADQSLDNECESMALTPRARIACDPQIFVNVYETNSVSLSAVASIGCAILPGRRYYYATAAHAILSAPDLIVGEEKPPANGSSSFTAAYMLCGSLFFNSKY